MSSVTADLMDGSDRAGTRRLRETASFQPSCRTSDGGPFSDRYEDLGLLATGGMGEIRLARDLGIGRNVAVKLIRPDRAQGVMLERFVREAKLQGRLEHPSIVPVHEVGATPEGVPYFTMKQVRGVTLETVLARLASGDPDTCARFTQRKLLTAFENVCLAVAFAHEQGVVHRDLKPANIMLGDFGETYVLDWGIAAALGETSDGPGDGVHVSAEGSPGYMAPEQVCGTPEGRLPSVDIYALGAILFEILTLEPLHSTPTPDDLLASTLEGTDARASLRAPAKEVPPELDAICVRATELHPALRFPSARALSDALERFLDGERDLELRRELAQAEVDAAERLLEPRPGAEPEETTKARGEALNHLGRAVALDPMKTRATQKMLELLLLPPPVLPVQAAIDFASACAREVKPITRLHAFVFVCGTLGVLLGAYFEVTDPWVGASIFGGLCLSFGSNLLILRSYRHYRLKYTVSLMGSLIAAGFTSRIFAPFIGAPMLTAMLLMGFLLTPTPSLGRRTLVIGTIALVVPWVLEWTGLVSPTYAIQNGAIVIFGSAGDLSPTLTQARLFAFSSFGVLFVPWVYATYVRPIVFAAKEREYFQLWQLRQLLPEAARRNVVTDLPRPGEASQRLQPFLQNPEFLDAMRAVNESTSDAR